MAYDFPLHASAALRRGFLAGLCLLLLGGAAAIAAPTSGTSGQLLAQQASRAYEEGRYGEAAQLYQRLAESAGASAEVHYDLGNCHFKLGDLGRAILQYRRALARDPSLASAQKNLELARTLLPARVARWQPSPMEAFIASVPQKLLQGLLLAFSFLGNLGLALVIFVAPGRLRRGAAGTLIAAFFCAGLAGMALLYARTVLPAHRPAVVLEPAAVYAGPETQGVPLATLPAGSEIILTTRAGDRALVMWGEGRGWTAASAVEVP
jgi:tetratricopeptide (TPR) repeat protein